MRIRYVVTAIKADGSRQLAMNNWARSHRDTEKEMQQHLDEIYAANNDERIAETLGTDLKIEQKQCYDSGECMGTYFEAPPGKPKP